MEQTNTMIEETRNFDWDETRRKLCIFLPHFQCPEFTECSIRAIHTQVDPRDYIIIIGNDNVSQNWDHLKEFNVKYFTIKRQGVPEGTPRNSCYVRNYALKRMQSEFYIMKDAEVLVYGDFIYNAINFGTGWRPGSVYSLTAIETDKLLVATFPRVYVESECVPKMDKVPHPIFEDPYYLKQTLLEADGKINPTTYFHYAYCAPLKIVQQMNGYDEDYSSYGWEDTDMYGRLFAQGVRICPDPTTIAVHPHHPRNVDSKREVEVNMRDLYITKSPVAWYRNLSGWGDGVQHL